MKESSIQKAIIDYLRKNHIWHFRFNAVITTFGLPDIIAIYKGYFVGIEVKTPTGVSTELQNRMRESIIEAGGYSEFVRSVEDVKTLLQRIDHEHTTKTLSSTNTR